MHLFSVELGCMNIHSWQINPITKSHAHVSMFVLTKECIHFSLY